MLVVLTCSVLQGVSLASARIIKYFEQGDDAARRGINRIQTRSATGDSGAVYSNSHYCLWPCVNGAGWNGSN
jgi:hypothetical protein